MRIAATATASTLPPPPPDEMGVVPWDPPDPPAAATPVRLKVAPRPEPAPAVTVAGVRLSGRPAGFVDAAYDMGRTLRDHPGTSIAVIGAGVALGVVAPTVMLVLTTGIAAYGAGSVAYHELRAAIAHTSAERDTERFQSGASMFLTLTSLPLRSFRLLRSRPPTL